MALSVEVLEERMNNIIASNSKEHAAILQELEKMNKRLDDQLERINDRLDLQFVTRREFAPVRIIAYTIVGTVSVAFLKNVIAILLG